MPFLFKYAVDHLNNAAPLMDTVAGSAMTLTTALLLGCKFDILINDELNKLLPHAPNSPKCWINKTDSLVNPTLWTVGCMPMSLVKH